jgi:cyclophilin family peptidyl-prolyl cis-trans isomerase|tara:strand:+ start:337 stop:972 length:636 start_codon:yes stop_codon:yes gene_type:complete
MGIKIFFSLLIIAVIIGLVFLIMALTKGEEENEQQELPVNNQQTESNQAKNMTATISTNFGEVKLEFFEEDAPNTVANFIKLANDGFYNGTKFHRVIKGFMIQGGDPLTKDETQSENWGTGGPGYTFKDEIHANNKNTVGTISMANSGPNTNGSQFFINVANSNFLDEKHTVFGRVIEGMDVVEQIENTPTGNQDRPVESVIVESITVTEG